MKKIKGWNAFMTIAKVLAGLIVLMALVNISRAVFIDIDGAIIRSNDPLAIVAMALGVIAIILFFALIISSVYVVINYSEEKNK